MTPRARLRGPARALSREDPLELLEEDQVRALARVARAFGLGIGMDRP